MKQKITLQMMRVNSLRYELQQQSAELERLVKASTKDVVPTEEKRAMHFVIETEWSYGESHDYIQCPYCERKVYLSGNSKCKCNANFEFKNNSCQNIGLFYVDSMLVDPATGHQDTFTIGDVLDQ